jgi:hypothetical protein
MHKTRRWIPNLTVCECGIEFLAQLTLTGVAVEKLISAKIAKMKLRQDAI